MESINERERRILTAAFDVLQRYGVKRTTMADIAEAAGISRQTLYAVFASKEALLSAIVEFIALGTLGEIDQGLAGADTLSAKLDAVFTALIVRQRQMLDASPEAADIVIGLHQSATGALKASYERYRAAIADMLRPYAPAIETAGLTVEELADFIHTAGMGIKKEARDARHMTALLDALKIAVLAIAEPPTGHA